jgi:hypothetical protein
MVNVTSILFIPNRSDRDQETDECGRRRQRAAADGGGVGRGSERVVSGRAAQVHAERRRVPRARRVYGALRAVERSGPVLVHGMLMPAVHSVMPWPYRFPFIMPWP